MLQNFHGACGQVPGLGLHMGLDQVPNGSNSVVVKESTWHTHRLPGVPPCTHFLRLLYKSPQLSGLT